MPNRKALAFIVSIWVAAAVALWVTEWDQFVLMPRASFGGFAALLVIAMASEVLAIRVSLGKGGSASITFIPLLASVQLFGGAAAVILMAVTGLFGEFAVRRKELVRGLFNVCQWILATTLAAWTFQLLGGSPLHAAATQSVAEISWSTQLWPFIAFGIVFLLINHSTVSVVIALNQGLPFQEVLAQLLGRSGGSLQDLLISPVAIGVAFLYVQLGIIGIVVALFPLLFVRHAYYQNNQLRDANDDLLRALVKAIEIRDPYTSGHSLRVRYLAREIAKQLGLSRARVSRVEKAALLHDIGKVDAVYTEILLKPDALTDEERQVIESHVTKGEELLRSLNSVPEEVIAAVRHHHERPDGSGYPDGLQGRHIPLASRIIGVCDAIDAMLSDRPYRDALPLTTVVEQLRKNAGTQFDGEVVNSLLATDLLTEYAQVMRGGHGLSHVNRVMEPSRRRSRRRAMRMIQSGPTSSPWLSQ